MEKAIAYPLLVVLIALILYLLLPKKTSEPIELPSNFNYLPSVSYNQLIKHDNYFLSYSEKHEQAEWVAYELKKEHLSSTNFKRPLFELDSKVKTGSAHWRNYKNSGYSKGHLLPAADRKNSREAYQSTFLMSNVSPQRPSFNGGLWNRLEQKVRYWAQKERHLYVVTGGVLTDHLETIGQEEVSIPEHFYKILLDYSKPEIKAIAFLVPHKNSNRPLHEFVVSIDQIEDLTGIDFFQELPDSLENSLEKSSDYKNWSF